MSDADTKRAIKAYAFDKIETLIKTHKHLNPDDVEVIMDDAHAQLKVIDEQAAQRNR